MAILVALSFFFLLVSETMPASSENSIIGELYAVTMVEMTLSFFLNVIVLRFHHMTEEEVPHWVKVRIIFSIVSSLHKIFVSRDTEVCTEKYPKCNIKKLLKMDTLYSRYSRKNKKTTESVIFHLYSKDILSMSLEINIQ